ncbi:MAG TPA: hypothetical protein P5079_04855 [Elusimicrobiota bacterium]|nr:hypothetical protein [Elusimicrobiota bacterium]
MNRISPFALAVSVVLGLAIAGLTEEPKPPKTVITGDRMNLLRKGAAVEFVGGVTLVRGNDFMKADRMVSEEKKGLTEAWGRVYLRRDDPLGGVRWESWAEEGTYSSQISSGTLWGRGKPVKVHRSPLSASTETQRMEMEALRFTFYDRVVESATQSTSAWTCVEAEGLVYVWMKESTPTVRDTQIWAHDAFYDGSMENVRFWGGYDSFRNDSRAADPKPVQPRARQTEGEEIRDLSGDEMTYFLNDKRLVVERNVRATILTPDSPLEDVHAPAR